MAFDGVVTKKIINELNSSLIGGKINKVLEPNKNEILLGIYSGGKNFTLLINVSSNYYRLHTTNTSKPNPITPPNFCMVLRKHLLGFRIKSIYNTGLERVVTIEFEGYNELNDLVSKNLIIELMGKHSNVVLTNEKNIIIDSLKHFDNSSLADSVENSREILPAHEYPVLHNTKKDISCSSFEEFKKIVEGCNDIISVVKSISNYYNGLSQNFVANITGSELDCTNVNSLKSLYNKLLNIINNLCNESTFCKLNENKKDYYIDLDKCDISSNSFLDNYYASKESGDLLKSYKNNLLKLVLTNLNRISKKLDGINKKLSECKDMDKYRVYGELLTSNLYKFSNNDRLESVKLDNYYENNALIDIPLDATVSPAENAKKYFKKYHKLKNASEIVSSQKKEVVNYLDYLESIVYELESSDCIEDLDEIYDEITENNVLSGNSFASRSNMELSEIKKLDTSKTKKKSKKCITSSSLSSNSCSLENLLTYTVDGFTFYVGKNNKQNDFIATKVGKNEDIWFHVKDFHGSHGVLKCNGNAENVKETTLTACAKIVVQHSKAKNSSNVPVDYCFAKYVKKPNSSKPGMVIFTHNKTLFVTA